MKYLIIISSKNVITVAEISNLTNMRKFHHVQLVIYDFYVKIVGEEQVWFNEPLSDCLITQ